MSFYRFLLFQSLIIPVLCAQETGPRMTFKLLNFPSTYTARLNLSAKHEVIDVMTMQKGGRTIPAEADVVSSQVANSVFRDELQQESRNITSYTPVFKKPIPHTQMPCLSSLQLNGTISINKGKSISNTIDFPFKVIYRGQSEVSFLIEFKSETDKGVDFIVRREEDVPSPSSTDTGKFPNRLPH